MKKKRSEQGQAILLLTAGIITLLGFAALAIDGGRLYSERRTIQGVSDTTAMTGALYLAHNTPVGQTEKDVAIQEALDRAAENGYSSSQVTVTIVEDAGFFVVTSTINSAVEPTLARLFYSGDFDVAAKSVARVENNNVPPPFALGMAFYSINKTACRAIDLIGNNTVHITGSGLFSNSSCDASKGAFNILGSAGIDLTGDITTPGGITVGGSADVTIGGDLNDDASHNTLPNISEPDCTGLPPQSVSGPNLAPGIYSGGMKFVGDDYVMTEGLYCVDGDFSINNGSLTGNNVTIFMRTGKVSITGGVNELTAPDAGQANDASGQVWDGMLFFQAYGNTSDFKLTGNNGSNYVGSIFVPDGHCSLVGGGESAGFDTQFVCDTIDVSGNADVFLNFDITNKYIPPPPTHISLVE